MKKHQSDSPLYRLIVKSRRTLVFAALFSMASNILMLVMPIYSMQVLDRVVSSHSIETLLMLTLIATLALVFFGIFMAIRTSILNSIAQWLDATLAPHLLEEAITRSALGLNVSASQYQRDLLTIKGFITGGAVTSMLDAPWSIIFLFVIYMISPVLGVIALAGLAILIVSGLVNEYATRKAIRESGTMAIKSQAMADIASRNAEAIESMGMMKQVIKHWNEAQQAASVGQQLGASRANVIQSVLRVLRMLVQIAVTGVGGYLALENEMSVGGMIASSILVGRALAPFEGAIALWRQWIGARESYRRLNDALTLTQQVERGTLPLPAPEGKLSIEALIYTPPRSIPIIKGMTFSIEPGESLGIIGPSAAGKSTLSKLIMGLVPPTHGTVRLDGAETFKWNRENFGKYVGYLPQNVDLFPGTIKDNIARMDKNAPMELVIEAAKRAHAHELILRLPNAYETECGLSNLGLSPGQRQRIGMARALYGDPRFVVMDEPNSNLDGEGERALIETMSDLKRQRITFVVVAHRPTIVSMVDKIMVMKAGTIERFGAREEVLKHYVASNPLAPQTPAKVTA